MKQKLQFLMTVVATVLFGSISMAQCPAGQAEVTVEVTTDPWGYENYWEMTPQGDACGTNTVAAYGNTVVGCLGEGLQVAADTDPGVYANSAVVTETVGCFPIGNCYTIHNVDDYGDNAAGLDVMVNGVSVATATGGASTFDFCVTPQSANDLTVDSVGVGTYYTWVPLAHATALSFEATVRNAGTNSATNAMATVNVNTVATDATASTASLASGASVTTAGTVGFTASSQGIHVFDFVATMTEVDDNDLNDTMTVSIMYNDTVLARDNNTSAGSLGFGAGDADNGKLGLIYGSPVADQITSVSAYFAVPTEGDSTSFSIYDMAAGVPNAVIGGSMNYTFTNADATGGGVWITLPMTAPVAVAAGTDFAVIVNENSNNVSLGTDGTSSYEAGTNMIISSSITSGLWVAAESLSPTFGINYLLRPNFGNNAGVSINENFLTSANVYPNPTNGMVNITLTEEVSDASMIVYSVDGTIVSSYIVSGTQFSVNLEGLSKGLYIIELNNGSDKGVYRIVKD